MNLNIKFYKKLFKYFDSFSVYYTFLDQFLVWVKRWNRKHKIKWIEN